MSFRSQVGDVRRRLLSGLYRRPVPLGTRGPIITFSFDDFPRSALTTGAAVLESFGARATYYVTMSLMNAKNDLGEQFRNDDLHSVLDRGHELASHTFSHLSARQVRYDVFKGDVERGEQAIREETGMPGSGNFAYPYGDVTLGAKKRLGPELKSCRGTCGGLNGPDVDLNLLRANSLYGDLDRADAAKRLILENEEQGRWLIFYSHDVAAKPSPFGCTLKLLEAVCSFAAAREARFMTVAQVMKDLEQQRDPGPIAQLQTSHTSLCQSSCVPPTRSDDSSKTVSTRS
ncbi:MAG: polysaccharide deacetylase family protein [Terracidiphilus sp.]|jgi:peptidoglycan/xylan/chitin deacetylase (PgdA/CDA1 family)